MCVCGRWWEPDLEELVWLRGCGEVRVVHSFYRLLMLGEQLSGDEQQIGEQESMIDDAYKALEAGPVPWVGGLSSKVYTLRMLGKRMARRR